MTRNDTFFKILFAIQIALLPLVIASNIFLPQWGVSLFVVAVLVVKIWLELFKNKDLVLHNIIVTISNVLSITTLVIFFTSLGYIDVVLCIFVVIFAILMNVLKLVCNKNAMPEMIDAVDTCYMLFECLTIATLAIVMLYDLVANIALFALLLTSIVSVAYKVYYLIKYNDVIGKLKNIFRRK